MNFYVGAGLKPAPTDFSLFLFFIFLTFARILFEFFSTNLTAEINRFPFVFNLYRLLFIADSLSTSHAFRFGLFISRSLLCATTFTGNDTIPRIKPLKVKSLQQHLQNTQSVSYLNSFHMNIWLNDKLHIMQC